MQLIFFIIMIFTFFEKIFAYLFPFYCLGCGTIDWTICPDCLNKIPLFSLDQPKIAYLDNFWVVCRYEKHGTIASALHNWKYEYQFAFANPLKLLFRKQIERLLQENPVYLQRLETGQVVITFVPMHEEKLRQREFNQAEELAGEFRNIIPGVIIKKLVEKSLSKPAQMTLTAEERFKNVQDVYKIGEGFDCPEEVLIIDDVLTTGATMQEIARVLKTAGVKKVKALVLAKQTD